MRRFIAIFLILFSLKSFSEEIDRLPSGVPNLNGVWQVMNTANFNLEAHSSSAALQMVEGPVVPIPHPSVVALGAVGSIPGGLSVVEEGKIPYKKIALRKRDNNKANWIDLDPEIKCYLPGVPRATYMPYPFQIFHSEEAIFFAYQYAGAVRNIYLEDPGPAPVDSWMGQSFGYWEGDIWVVEVTGQDERTWFDRAGNFHSYEMKVTERWNLVSENVIEYEATIEDPQTFTRPWTIKLPLYRRLEEGYELPQFKCVEFVEEMMYGRYRKGREGELNFQLNN